MIWNRDYNGADISLEYVENIGITVYNTTKRCGPEVRSIQEVPS
jgi:hypothetical protein